MIDGRTICVSISVYPEKDADLVKVIEVLARAAAGLVLEGIGSTLSCNSLEEEDADKSDG